MTARLTSTVRAVRISRHAFRALRPIIELIPIKCAIFDCEPTPEAGTRCARKRRAADQARRRPGVNSITGEGFKEAMAGAEVVIDLANSPSFEDKAVLEFFETSGRNLLFRSMREPS